MKNQFTWWLTGGHEKEQRAKKERKKRETNFYPIRSALERLKAKEA